MSSTGRRAEKRDVCVVRLRGRRFDLATAGGDAGLKVSGSRA